MDPDSFWNQLTPSTQPKSQTFSASTQRSNAPSIGRKLFQKKETSPLSVNVPLTKKKKSISKKSCFNDKFKILELGAIQKGMGKYRYKVSIVYLDDQHKKHAATINFGKTGKEYFVDNRNVDIRMHYKQKLKNVKNFFTHAYWDNWLLNTCPTMQAAHGYYRQEHGLL